MFSLLGVEIALNGFECAACLTLCGDERGDGTFAVAVAASARYLDLIIRDGDRVSR